MKNILLLGIGGTGTNVVNLIHKEILSHGVPQGSAVSALILDMDNHSAEKQSFAKFFSLASPLTVKQACDMLGKEALREWFPVPEEGEVNNRYSSISLSQSNLWRKGAFLALNVFLNQNLLDDTLAEWIKKDPYASFEVYVISSLAGACGSGCLIPLTLYIKRLLKEGMGITPAFYAALLGPDVHADLAAGSRDEVADRMRANAYATIRELNAIQAVATHGAGFEDVRFRLGSPLAPTGVLFDSADPRFHTPESAPFSHVYLHGRKVSRSIREHEESLAHFLYTLCGTDAAAYISHITSSAAASNNQNNGRAGLYSSVTFARMEHPVDALADYAAHAMVRDAVQNEWLKLHNETEERILVSEREAKESHRRFFLHDGEYAKRFLASLEKELEKKESPLRTILSDATERPTGKRGEPPVQYLDEYVKILRDELNRAVPDTKEIKEDMASIPIVPKPGFFASKAEMDNAKERVLCMAADVEQFALDYFRTCVDKIRSASTNLANCVLPMDAHHTDPLANTDLSLTHHLLNRGGEGFIHPVAAMAQLCRLKFWMMKELDSPLLPWDALETGRVDELPHSVVTNAPTVRMSAIRCSASFYLRHRVTGLLTNWQGYREARKTDPEVDSRQLKEDALATVDAIHTMAGRLLKERVLTTVMHRLDILIEEYRCLFGMLADFKEQLHRSAEVALCRCTGVAGSTAYLSSDENSKIRFFQNVESEFSPYDFSECYHAVGKEFFHFAYDKSVAINNMPPSTPSADGRNAHVHGIFDTAVREFTRAVLRSDYYKSVRHKSVFEVIADSNAWNSPADLMEAFRKHLSLVTNLARFTEAEFSPLSNTRPATVAIAMVEKGAADFLRQNANDLGLDIGSPQASTTTQNRAVVKDLFSKCGITGVEIAVSNNFPSGKIDVISLVTSLRAEELAAFIELTPPGEPNCYSAYRRVISFVKKGLENGDRDRDLSNPHLGNALYEVSNLPYLNPNAYFVFPEEAPHVDIPPQ